MTPSQNNAVFLFGKSLKFLPYIHLHCFIPPKNRCIMGNVTRNNDPCIHLGAFPRGLLWPLKVSPASVTWVLICVIVFDTFVVQVFVGLVVITLYYMVFVVTRATKFKKMKLRNELWGVLWLKLGYVSPLWQKSFRRWTDMYTIKKRNSLVVVVMTLFKCKFQQHYVYIYIHINR